MNVNDVDTCYLHNSVDAFHVGTSARLRQIPIFFSCKFAEKDRICHSLLIDQRSLFVKRHIFIKYRYNLLENYVIIK